MNLTNVESIYFHFPFCRHLCNYCDFFKYQLAKTDVDKHDQIDRYQSYLENSWDHHQALMEGLGYEFSNIKTLYLGGGTPSLWDQRGAEFFHRFFLSKLKLSDSVEFTMEVDPGSWTSGGIKAWQAVGVNRFSLGVQCLDRNIFPLVDRGYDFSQTYQTLDYFADQNLNFACDFLIGLPRKRGRDQAYFSRSITKELADILSFQPSHISLYILSVRSNYPHIPSLPPDEDIAQEYLLVHDFLVKAGFHHYEVSNYALSSYESRHNQQYWDHQPVAAFGPSASGFLSPVRYRWLAGDAKASKEVLSDEQLRMEKLYLTLRQSRVFDLATVAQNSDQSIDDLNRIFQQWQLCNYVHYHQQSRYNLTAQGWLILDSLIQKIL